MPITVIYTNWRGETSRRNVTPTDIRWGVSEWHQHPCWLLAVNDLDKRESREFALADCDFTIGAGGSVIIRERDNALSDRDSARAEAERLREALTPSAETKAAYRGEFSIPLLEVDEDDNDVLRRATVPWTTIKEIMAAIRARAALSTGEPPETEQ